MRRGLVQSAARAMDEDLDDLLRDLSSAGVGAGRASEARRAPTASSAPPPSAAAPSKRPAAPPAPAPDLARRGPADDLDALLADLDAAFRDAPASAPPPSGDPPRPAPAPSDRGEGASRSRPTAPARSCAPRPLVAACAVPRGGPASAFGDAVACDALRCVACDFDVLAFEGARWRGEKETRDDARRGPDARGLGGGGGCGRSGGTGDREEEDEKDVEGPAFDYVFCRTEYPDRRRLLQRSRAARGFRAYCCQCTWRSLGGDEREGVGAAGGALRWVCGGHDAPP